LATLAEAEARVKRRLLTGLDADDPVNTPVAPTTLGALGEGNSGSLGATPASQVSGRLAAVTDFLSKETRSRVMSRIRAKDTKPELALRRELFRRGIRGWRCHAKTIPGKPDLAFTRWRVAVFVDGRFWHGHPDFFTPGKSGPYWDAKIARTQERDRLADEALTAAGWRVLRFWDFEVENDLERCIQQVLAARAAAASDGEASRAA
jgi:DNA mismatch endonuclease, patch repair protein